MDKIEVVDWIKAIGPILAVILGGMGGLLRLNTKRYRSENIIYMNSKKNYGRIESRSMIRF
jgi:hypothetical protein